MALNNNRSSSRVKNLFFLNKKLNFRFIFLKVFNAIDSPGIVSSSKQQKYATLEYCFISIPLYIILSTPSFFNFCCKTKSMHFVLPLSNNIKISDFKRLLSFIIFVLDKPLDKPSDLSVPQKSFGLAIFNLSQSTVFFLQNQLMWFVVCFTINFLIYIKFTTVKFST